MKLGEALSIRARQAQQMVDLMGRIKASAVAQEGDKPAEDAAALIEAYMILSGEHSAIVKAIIQTNVATQVGDVTLLDLLQRREVLIRERNLYGATARAASETDKLFRYSRSEIKMVPQIDIQTFRQSESEAANLLTQLDLAIQKLNWETDLLS